MADRDLPRIAGEDVQAEHRDEEDPDLRGERDVVIAQAEREDGEHRRHRNERGEHRDPRPHTRLTSRCPKSPDGLRSNTTRMTANAAGVCNSDVILKEPMCPYWTTRLSETPIRRPPTTAPVGLSR